ncbi:sensor histidine kinase [Acidovorax sp. BL-A-41-H1]|uniref:sensor histidine kinase n=1 Tax=Acidovorax sp. BL-A-41-H1 TaxID=3421102 RepID=UPI003F7A6973
MSWLDIPTALFVLGLLYVTAPGITWAVLAQDSSPAAALWCAGGLLFGGGILLASLANRLPAVLGVLLTNILFCASCAMRIQSLRWDLGRPVAWQWLALPVSLAALFTAITHWALGWYLLRAAVNTALVAAGVAYIAHLALMLSQQEKSRNALFLACIYLALVLALLVRVFEIMVHPAGDPVPVARPATTALIALTGMITAVAGHFCYLGLVLDRARRRERVLVGEKAQRDSKILLQQELRQVERQRSIDQMSVSLAHELSQPVGAVLTNAQTGLRALEQQRMTPQELAPLLQQIEHSARHASRVIERIRSFIKPSRMPHQTVNLADVCDSACELIATELRRQGIELLRPAPRAVAVHVQGDELELTQALLNGLRNATDALARVEHRQIRLMYGCEAPWAWMRLEDNGPGLPADQLRSATEPFYTTKASGLGLGLTIVESIAERHGGRLILAHDAPGGLGGATFELRLPLTTTMPAPAVPANASAIPASPHSVPPSPADS